MSQKIGDTKVTILESCINPRSWSELVRITSKSEPTLMVHLNDLQNEQLIQKTSEGFYVTTDAGLTRIDLIPNTREVVPNHRVGIEAHNVLQAGLGRKYDVVERFAGILPILDYLVLRGYAKKKMGAFVNAIGEAVRYSVTTWVPGKVEIDKYLSEEINHIVQKMINQKAVISDGKLRIIIDVDFPMALDRRIRTETDPEIKKALIENRDKIIKDVWSHWESLFDTN